MTDELERRLMEALDAKARPADDPVLAEALGDPAFARKVAELESLDGWLREWETPAPSDDEFDALARRIEQRLGESFEDSDATQAPVFDDADARVRSMKGSASSGSYSLAALTGPAATRTPSAASTDTGPGLVLGGKRPASRVPVFLAVAAMAGLAVTAGVATLSSSDEPMVASAGTTPAAMAPAEMAQPEMDRAAAPAPAAEFAPEPMRREAIEESEAADSPADDAYGALALNDLALNEGSESEPTMPEAPEATRGRSTPARMATADGRGGGGSADDVLMGLPSGSSMQSSSGGRALGGRALGGAPPSKAPPTVVSAESNRAAASPREAAPGATSLEDRLRACAGPEAPARLSVQLTVAEGRVTAVRVRNPSSLASQASCFVRALRDERFEGGPRLERTYRLR